MEVAVLVMNQSIQEPREDKASPKVGAILIKPDGTEETAFRGELRHGVMNLEKKLDKLSKYDVLKVLF